MSEITEQIGRMIKDARKAKGLKQADLAQKLGISQVAVNHYEDGKRNLTLDTIQKIATALKADFNIQIKG